MPRVRQVGAEARAPRQADRPPAEPRPGPTARTAFVAEYRLLLRSIATRGRLVAIGGLAVLGLVTALAVNAASPDDRLEAAAGFVNGNLTTFVPVGVLVFGAAALGDLIDDGSLVYLWLRPVSSTVHVLAAWAATVTVAGPLVGIPVIAAAAVIDADPDLLAGAVLGLVVAVLAYGALFVTAGIRFRRALPWGLVYILIWEGFVASAGETAAKLAVRSYVRSILSNFAGVEMRLAEFATPVAVIVPLLVGAVALVYATRRLARTDVA